MPASRKSDLVDHLVNTHGYRFTSWSMLGIALDDPRASHR